MSKLWVIISFHLNHCYDAFVRVLHIHPMQVKKRKHIVLFQWIYLKLISKKNQLPHGLAHSINYHFITANVVFFMFNSDFVKKKTVLNRKISHWTKFYMYMYYRLILCQKHCLVFLDCKTKYVQVWYPFNSFSLYSNIIE